MKLDRSKIKRILTIFLIGLSIGQGVNLIFDTEYFFNWNAFVSRSIFSVVLTLFLWQGNQLIVIQILKKNPWDKKPTKTVALILIFTVLYSLTVMIGFYLYIWFVLNHKTGFVGFYKTFQLGLYVCFSISVIWILVIFANYFYRYWKKALLREEQLKQESLVLQYESLKNQVNPHFLFNSLNVLTSLIEKDTQASIKYVKQLSEVFRYVLDQNIRELVPISIELDFIKSYIYLQHIRFNDNFRVDIDIRETNFMIVPMALQILLENAVKHNEISSERPLLVTIYDDEECLYITNYKQLRSNLPDSNQIGLKTLHFQYDFLSGRKMEVSDTDKEFVVKLPKIKA